MDIASENTNYLIPDELIGGIRDQCLCLAAQRAARQLARRFDRVFQPLGITNGQFSLMVALQGMKGPRPGQVADLLAMDQTTVTAAVKALSKRGLVETFADAGDQRARRVALTEAGRALLAQAVPIWRSEHGKLAEEMAPGQAKALAGMLNGLRA